jgi:hypothetical protein
MTTLELELVELKTRVERLEAVVHRLASDRHEVAPPAPGEPLDQERLLAWLKAEGLIVDPPSMARVHAERWRALPEEEKQAHIRFMRNLVLDPPLSQIIIEHRR